MSERHAQAGKIGAHMSWANTADPAARTANGRAAFMAKFLEEADPEGVLSPAERERRAEHLRKAHFARLAMKSAAARRKKASAA